MRKTVILAVISIVIILLSGGAFLIAAFSNPTDDLRVALEDNDLYSAEKAVKEGADLNCLNTIIYKHSRDYFDFGNGTINYALIAGNVEVADYLIKHGADPNYVDNNGISALACAASSGELQMVQKMLDKGGDIKKGSGEQTILNYVLQNKAELSEDKLEKTVDYILKAGGKTNEETEAMALKLGKEEGYYRCASRFISKEKMKQLEGKERLFYISIEGTVNELEKLENEGINIFQINNCGENLLMCAARYGSRSVVEYLLAKGVDPEKHNSYGRTALTEAVRCSQIETAEMLLKHGAKLQVNKSGLGEAADTLCYAAAGGELAFMKKMKKLGCPFEKGEVYTALCRAIEEEQYGSVKYLCENYFPVNTLTMDGTLLMYAAEYSNAKMIACLIELGADVNQLTDMGTALYWAVVEREYDNAECLLKAGADPNLNYQEKDGEDDGDCCHPLCEAAKSSRTDFIKLLINYGADVEPTLNEKYVYMEDDIRSYLANYKK